MNSSRRPPTRSTAAPASLERARLGLAPDSDRLVSQPADQTTTGGMDFDAEAAVRLLADEFEQVIREDSNLNTGDRETLQEHFITALQEAADQQKALQVPNRNDWQDTVNALRDSGAIQSSDADDLLRRFEGVLQSFERRDSRVALEFARRLETEGAEQALVWYRAQNAGAAPAGKDGGYRTAQGEDQPLRSEVVSSKSRRPRGPPVRR